jgi:KUP system potassium uptake protein
VIKRDPLATTIKPSKPARQARNQGHRDPSHRSIGPSQPHEPARTGTWALSLAALGVVYGDIGTSPLYALQTLFSTRHHAVEPSIAHITGVISLVVWALVFVVTVKYVLIVLRADHQGEGGVLSLATLIHHALLRRRHAHSDVESADRTAHPRTATWALTAGIVGACFFFGDSVITPAISVLSAVEGATVAFPEHSHLVVPAALAILVVLFSVQRFGTAGVGGLFGPVMLVWFLTLAALGLPQVVARPEILVALSPVPGLVFLATEPLLGFVAMGAVVLAVTGAEALYADIGHFGRRPIARAWLWLVLPALLLNYLGQGALILRDPGAVANPFFRLAPDWAVLPLTGLAVVATVIAAQAVITGAYSVARQAMRLGRLPPLEIRRTSAQAPGQIYVPLVNWLLMGAVVVVVLLFGSSAALASAYGLAVTITLVITTVLLLAHTRLHWGWPPAATVALAVVVFTFELTFLTANLAKVHDGGWLPLLVGATLLAVMGAWNRGHRRALAVRRQREGSVGELLIELTEHPVPRVPGTAVFPHASAISAPLALRTNLELNGVLHENTVIVRVVTREVPHVPRIERLALDELVPPVPGVCHVTVHFGFFDLHDVPGALAAGPAGPAGTRRTAPTDPNDGAGAGIVDVPERAHYLLSHVVFSAPRATGLRSWIALWPTRLFVALTRAAASPSRHFHLPVERTSELGTELPL